MAELPRLRVGLTLDSQTFIRETNRVIDSVNNMSRRVTTQNASMQRSFNQVTGSLNTLRAGFAALGVGAALRSLAQAQIAFDRINNTLRAGTGSAQAAARGYQFVRSEAQRLGLDLETAAGQFAKLAAASRGTVLEGEKTRDIFSAVAEAATVLGLSAEQTGGALTAIEQIISKGTVSAEELRGQLGERLPGAFQIAARAIGVTTEQLGEMLKAGELTAEELLPALATELRKTFGPEVESAAQGLQATLNRLNTSWFEFRTAVAQGGVAQALSDIAKGLTDAASGSDEFATTLGADLGTIIRGFGEGLRVAATHLSELSALVVTFISYKAAELFLNIANAIRTTTAAMLGFNVAMRASPIGLAATAIGVVVGLLYEFRDATINVGDRTTTIGGLVIEIWEKIRAGIELVLPGLKKVAEAVGAVLDAVGISVAQAAEPFDVMAQKLAVVQSQLTQMREMSAAIVASGVTPDIEITNEIARLEAAQKDLVTQLDAAQLAQTHFKKAADETSESTKNQGQATDTLTDEEKKLAKQLAETVAGLTAEADAAKLLYEAHKRGAIAVRDAEILIEAENVARRLKIGLLTKEGQEIFHQIRAKRLDEDATKRLQDAEEARFKVLQDITEEEGKRRLGQASAGGLSAPGTIDKDKIKTQSEEIARAFEQTQDAIQQSFADTFTNIFDGGVTSAQDFATELKGIFTRLAGEIAALMIIRPILTSGALAGATGAVAPSLTQQFGFGTLGGGPGGFLGAPSGASLGGLLLAGGLGAAGGTTLGGLFGGFGGIGGGVGGGLGAVLGTASPLGPLGGLIGGIGGSLLGGFVGSLFGGGGGEGSEIRNLRGALGAITGTSEAVKFVQDFDRKVSQLLNERQRGIADRALRAAAGVSLKYGEEGLSAGDIQRLTAARVRPIAEALGFRAAAFRGLSGEEAITKLGEALNVQQQIQDLTSGFGAFRSQARALTREFDQLAASAKEFGISFASGTARRAAGFDLIRQQLANLGGVTTNFADQLTALNKEFYDARQVAYEFGFSIVEVKKAQQQATEALKAQQRAQLDVLALTVTNPFQQLADPLQDFLQDIRFADLNPLKQFENARREFERVANLARAGSTIAIQQLQSVGQQYIELAGTVGASPLAAQVRGEVAGVIQSVLADLDRAQREASRGIESEIRAASAREVDTLREMIAVGLDIVSEIKRLGRR